MTVPILIAGPTASGKSALALDLAERCNGVIVNADSLQVYRELRILTARPSLQDEARVPHALYGHVPAGEAYSVARWIEDVGRALGDACAAGRRPIIVGGTGLYFKALLEGLSPIPPIPEPVRRQWREAARRHGAGVLHAELAARDPEMAARLRPTDTQRLTRALEVIVATGQSLAEWQRLPGTPVLHVEQTVRLLVLPPRAVLQARCDARFDAMLAAGVLDEVRALTTLELDPALPAMQALGVAELVGHLAGRLSLEEAATRAKTATRQYVKRQSTWLNRNMISWNCINSEEKVETSGDLMHLIDG